MRSAFIIALIIAALISPVIHASDGGGVEVLLELPDGRVFWDYGYDEITVLKDICDKNNLSLRIYNSSVVVEGYPLQEYSWVQKEWIPGDNGSVVAWSSGTPVATPLSRYPRFSPAAQTTRYSAGPVEVWNFTAASTLTGGIDSTPVGFGDYVIFNSWNGLYVLRNGSLVWSNSSVKGMGTPYVYNGTIYVGASDGYLYAFGISGNFKFRFRVSKSPGYTGISSSPIVVNNTVYIGGFEADNSSGKLYALSAQGTEMWNISLNSSVYYGAPAYYNGVIYVPLAGRYNASSGSWYPDFGIAAVQDGRILWKFRTGAPVKSTPLVRDASIFFTCTDGYLYRLDLNGSLVWKVRIGYSTSSPNYHDGTIFVGSGSFSTQGRIYAVDKNGVVLWNRTMPGGVQGSITLSPPFLLFSVNSEHGGVYCFNFRGEETWNFTTGNYVLSSPSIVDRTLYFGDDDGVLHALRDVEKPEIRFRGEQFYRYGDMVNITVEAGDNIGVRWMKVHLPWGDVWGKNEVNVSFVANFTGKLDLAATAEDYDGNVARVIYSIYSYNRSLRISAPIGGEYPANESVQIAILVTDDSGRNVDGASVVVYMDGKPLASGTTINGVFSFALKVPPGTHEITVVASKVGYSTARYTAEIRGVEEESGGGIDTGTAGLVLGLILGISLLALAFALLLRERERKYREITRERMKDRK